MAESGCRHHCCVSVRTEEGLFRGLPAMPRELPYSLNAFVFKCLCPLTCIVLYLLGVPVSAICRSQLVGEKWTQLLLLSRHQPTAVAIPQWKANTLGQGCFFIHS